MKTRRMTAAATAVLALMAVVLTAVNAPGAGAATAKPHVAPPLTAAGYDLATSAGAVEAFGVTGHGDESTTRLTAPVVGVSATPDGGGYDLVAADGGIFNFGDAGFHGSAGNLRLTRPIVGMAIDAATGGYWLVAADGGIFAYNAPFSGSMGNTRLDAPVVGMAATPDGAGYDLVAADGGIFNFGDATFAGSGAGAHAGTPVVGMTAIVAGTTPATGSYRAEQSAPAAASYMMGATCPTSTRCLAVGGSGNSSDAALLLVTDDNGQHWSQAALPNAPDEALDEIKAIACPTATHCLALADDHVESFILSSEDAGSTWTISQTEPYQTLLNALSCATAEQCVAVGSDEPNPPAAGSTIALVTADGGGTWSTVPVAPKPSPGRADLAGVSCPTAATCTAVGYVSTSTTTTAPVIEHTADGGTTWQAETPPSGVASLAGIDCPTTSGCTAVGSTEDSTPGVDGGSVATTTDGGATWTATAVQTSADLYTVNCATAEGCLVGGLPGGGGSAIYAPTSGGGWSPLPLPAGTFTVTAIACRATTACIAVGTSDWYASGSPVHATGGPAGAILASADSGATWSQVAPLSHLGTAISCPTTSFCMVVGAGGPASSWQAPVTPELETPPTLVSTTDDGGKTWTDHGVNIDLPGGGFVPSVLSCSTPQDCMMLDTSPGGTDETASTTDGGATWTMHRITDGSSLNGISCPAPGTCVAVGEGPDPDVDLENPPGVAEITTDNGATWTQHLLPFKTVRYLEAVSCATVANCVAVGGDDGSTVGPAVVATTDGGATWTQQANPPGISVDLSAVSCPEPGDCRALAALRYGQPATATAVATTTDDGASWTTQQLPAGSGPMASIACNAAFACAAVGETPDSGNNTLPGGSVVTTQGPGAPWIVQPTPDITGTLLDVSCPAGCLAVGQQKSYAGGSVTIGN